MSPSLQLIMIAFTAGSCACTGHTLHLFMSLPLPPWPSVSLPVPFLSAQGLSPYFLFSVFYFALYLYLEFLTPTRETMVRRSWSSSRQEAWLLGNFQAHLHRSACWGCWTLAGLSVHVLQCKVGPVRLDTSCSPQPGIYGAWVSSTCRSLALHSPVASGVSLLSQCHTHTEAHLQLPLSKPSSDRDLTSALQGSRTGEKPCGCSIYSQFVPRLSPSPLPLHS